MKQSVVMRKVHMLVAPHMLVGVHLSVSGVMTSLAEFPRYS